MAQVGPKVTITAVDGDDNTFALPNKTINILPAAPTDLSASLADSGEVDLSWTAVTS